MGAYSESNNTRVEAYTYPNTHKFRPQVTTSINAKFRCNQKERHYLYGISCVRINRRKSWIEEKTNDWD